VAFRSISNSVPSSPKRMVVSALLPSRSSMMTVSTFWAMRTPLIVWCLVIIVVDGHGGLADSAIVPELATVELVF